MRSFVLIIVNNPFTLTPKRHHEGRKTCPCMGRQTSGGSTGYLTQDLKAALAEAKAKASLSTKEAYLGASAEADLVKAEEWLEYQC